MKQDKIRLLFDCLAAHATTEKEGFVFIFFEKLKIFQKNKNKPPPARRSVAH
jgi:hypothetical protein